MPAAGVRGPMIRERRASTRRAPRIAGIPGDDRRPTGSLSFDTCAACHGHFPTSLQQRIETFEMGLHSPRRLDFASAQTKKTIINTIIVNIITIIGPIINN